MEVITGGKDGRDRTEEDQITGTQLVVHPRLVDLLELAAESSGDRLLVGLRHSVQVPDEQLDGRQVDPGRREVGQVHDVFQKNAGEYLHRSATKPQPM